MYFNQKTKVGENYQLAKFFCGLFITFCT